MTEEICRTCDQTIPEAAEACPRCVFDLALEPSASVDETLPLPPPPLGLPSAEELSERLPGLRVLRSIGQGGMGAVFLGEQEKLGREVAIKVMAPELGRDPDFQSRFAREARALARLSHPNIVGVYDFGQVGDLLYLVMEYVDGVNLRRALKAGALAPEKALAIVPEICEALCYAHESGVIHRDIKPENLLLDKKGRVKIADFGLAKLVGKEAGSALTKSGYAMGTPHYMAPEQRERPLEVDHRADIYSLGVVFYEMLTGELPVGRFAPPSKKSKVSARLDGVVFKALEREPADRYQQVSELSTSLSALELRKKASPAKPRRWKPAAAAIILIAGAWGVAALGPSARELRATWRRLTGPAATDAQIEKLFLLARIGDQPAITSFVSSLRNKLADGSRLHELRDEKGRTPFMAAVAAGNIDGIKGLKAAGLDATYRSHRDLVGDSAAHIAARRGDAIALYLVASFFDDALRRSRNHKGETPLYLNLTEGGGRGYDELLYNPLADRPTLAGDTVLHAAARLGDLTIFKALVSKGDPSIPLDYDKRSGLTGRTVLMEAIAARSVALVKRLLSAPPRLDASDDQGRNAAHLALMTGDAGIISNVLDAMKSACPEALTSRDKEGRTPLIVAAQAQNIDALVALQKHGRGARDKRGRTAFWYAAQANDMDALDFLMTTRVCRDPDNEGVTPYMAAAEAGAMDSFRRIRESLISSGHALDQDRQDKRGENALMKAARAEQLAMVKALVGQIGEGQWDSSGGIRADVSAVDHRGWRAVEFALAAGHKTVADCLRASEKMLGVRERPTLRLWQAFRALEIGDRGRASRRILELDGIDVQLSSMPEGGLILNTGSSRYTLPRDSRSLAALRLAAASAADQGNALPTGELEALIRTATSRRNPKVFELRRGDRALRYHLDTAGLDSIKAAESPAKAFLEAESPLAYIVREDGREPRAAAGPLPLFTESPNRKAAPGE